jgi:transposase-like protein
MLESLWKWMSDWDVCKTYLRLKKDKKISYIAIDPNIGTVTDFNGGGNKTLFDRFF